MRRIFLSLLMCGAVMACSTTTGTSGGASAPPVIEASTTGGTATAQLNAIRAQAGRVGVARNGTLDGVARAHANDMAQRNFFSHTGSNGSSVGQRVRAEGYRY